MLKKVSFYIQFFWFALKGKETEFTTGSINRAIILLSIPMVAEMLMESLFAVIDVFFVAQVSVHAVATVGLTESVLMIIYSMAVGLSMAVTAIVARRVGEKKYKQAASVVYQAILLAIAISGILGIVGFIYASDILALMGGESTLIESCKTYTEIMFAGNITIILIFLINGAFRGAGNAAIAMQSLWIANGLNCILDPLLIFGLGPVPAFGVEGAAIATTLGRSVGIAYQLFYLFNGKSLIQLVLKKLTIHWGTIREILVVSSGGIFQFLVESASWIFLVRVISYFGSDVLAGYTIAFRIIVFTLMPSWGMSNAAATLVGQNLGAGKPERAEISVWRTALWNTLFLVMLAVIFFIYSNSIIQLFSVNEVVTQVGTRALKIICFGYVFFAYGMVVGQGFNGAGDTFTPLIISLIVFWVIQIPIAYIWSVYLDWGPDGVFLSIALAHSLYAIIAIILFRKGKWKKVKV